MASLMTIGFRNVKAQSACPANSVTPRRIGPDLCCKFISVQVFPVSSSSLKPLQGLSPRVFPSQPSLTHISAEVCFLGNQLRQCLIDICWRNEWRGSPTVLILSWNIVGHIWPLFVYLTFYFVILGITSRVSHSNHSPDPRVMYSLHDDNINASCCSYIVIWPSDGRGDTWRANLSDPGSSMPGFNMKPKLPI